MDVLHVKNMVCRRCVMAVEDICRELELGDVKVTLGCVSFSDSPAPGKMERLCTRLREVGFEPLQSRDLIVLEKIKAAVRHYARHYDIGRKLKLSAYLEETTGFDFRYLSRLFSSLESRTLMSYLMTQRIEYVKELLFDRQLTLPEIADRTGFSSVAHLSRAFKNTEGVTISAFRDNGSRSAIDEI